MSIPSGTISDPPTDITIVSLIDITCALYAIFSHFSNVIMWALRT